MFLRLWNTICDVRLVVVVLLGAFLLTSCAEYVENPVTNDLKSISACLPGGCAQSAADYRQLKISSDGLKMTVSKFIFLDNSVHYIGDATGPCSPGLYESARVFFKRNITSQTSGTGEVSVVDLLNTSSGLSSLPYANGSTIGVECKNGKYAALIDFGSLLTTSGSTLYSGTLKAWTVGIKGNQQTTNSNGGIAMISWTVKN